MSTSLTTCTGVPLPRDERWANLFATEADIAAGQQRLEAWAKDPASSESVVAVVGAGLTGMEAAKIFAEDKSKTVVMLERNAFMGGIWLSAANPESTVQVDPISFAPVEDAAPLKNATKAASTADPFASMAFAAPDVLERFSQRVAEYDLKPMTCFGVELVSFQKDDGADRAAPVTATLRLSGAHRAEPATVTVRFAALHLRLGDLKCPRPVTFPGEDTFTGRAAFGVGGDVPSADFKGKRVTIIGSGAFAIENVRRALTAGAATPVTVLTRRFDKCLFPEYATYTLRRMLNDHEDPAGCQDDAQAAKTLWRRTVATIRKVATLCGTEAKTLNENCIRTIGGEPHVLFNNAIPPLSSNVMFLAYYYGLVKYEEDEAVACDGDCVVTKSGRSIPTDIFIKCAGFEHNEGLLRPHMCNDAYFVDNQANITHNLRGDRINGTLVFGPAVQCRNFLISYYEDAQDYERPFAVLQKKPELYDELLAMAPARFMCDIRMVDYLTTIVLSEKLTRIEDEEMRGVLKTNLERRRGMYAAHLDDETYRRLDGAHWEKLSRHMHEVSGGAKPFLPYPFKDGVEL